MSKVIVVDGAGVVLLGGDDIRLFEDHGILNAEGTDDSGGPVGGARYLNVNDSMQLIAVDTLPEPWVPMAYSLQGGEFVLDDQSAAWQAYVVAVAPPAPTVPLEVSRRRGLQALFMMYALKEDHISAAIDADPTMSDDEKYLAGVEFKTSQTFERRRPLVVRMGEALGLDLDAVFIFAMEIP